jgi:hypothetical protein
MGKNHKFQDMICDTHEFELLALYHNAHVASYSIVREHAQLNTMMDPEQRMNSA